MEAFHGPSDLDVNHINNIRHDNRLENLEYVTKSENMKHALKSGNIHTQCVHKIDLKTNKIIKTYYSITEASKVNNVDKSGIRSVCRGDLGKVTIGGYKWKYATREEYEKNKDLIDIKIVISEPDGKQLENFDNYIIQKNGNIYSKKIKSNMLLNYTSIILTDNDGNKQRFNVKELIEEMYEDQLEHKQEKRRTCENSRSRRVCKIDIETGEVLRIYSKIAEAARDNNNIPQSGIKMGCETNKIKYGYKWKFLEKEEEEEEIEIDIDKLNTKVANKYNSNSYSMVHLYNFAKKLNISGYKKMRKKELTEKIKNKLEEQNDE
jgi:hypothetical protein